MENLADPGQAEAGLAASHPCPRAALDPIERSGSERTPDGVDNFTLRHRLAAADDLPIERILFDQFLFFLKRKLRKVRDAFSLLDDMILLLKPKRLLSPGGCHLSDSRCAGKARRLDPRQVKEQRRAFRLPDDEIAHLTVCTQPCKGGDDLSSWQRLHGEILLLQNLRDAFRRRRSVFLVRDKIGGRPGQDVAVNRRRHQHALAFFCRKLEDRMPHVPLKRPVIETVLSPSWTDPDLLCADHIVDLIRVHTGSVDDSSRDILRPARLHMVQPLLIPSDVRHFSMEMKIHAVLAGVLCKRKRQLERADNPACRRIKCRGDVLRQVRLHPEKFLSPDNSEPAHTIGNSARKQRLQLAHLCLVCADHERSISLKWNIQILTQAVHHLIAADVQLRHQRPHSRIEATVDDGAVRLGCPCTDILRAFEHADIRAQTRQRPCGSGTGHTGTDYHSIIHKFPSEWLLCEQLCL